MKKYNEMPDEMFREMMQCDKGIREARYAVGYGRYEDGRSITDGHYVNWPNYHSKWEISEEQMEIAKERFEQRRLEVLKIARDKGVLTWISMGMSYEPRVVGDLGNFRIRTNFRDKSGNVWFIEIHPVYGSDMKADSQGGFWGEIYDVTWNERAEREHKEKHEALLAKYGEWWKVPREERVISPAVKYEHIEERVPFTYEGVLGWVNERFGTDYRRLYLDRWFLSYDDVISEC